MDGLVTEKIHTLTDSDLLKLWKDPEFEASFSGGKTLQRGLFYKYGQHIRLNRIYHVLSGINDYLEQIPIRKKIPTKR